MHTFATIFIQQKYKKYEEENTFTTGLRTDGMRSEVTEGLDVVDRIQQSATDPYDRPLQDIRILRATVILPKEHASIP